MDHYDPKGAGRMERNGLHAVPADEPGIPALSVDGWKARADREAAAMLEELQIRRSVSYDDLQKIVAAAWLQGLNLGCHLTLAEVELALGRMQTELSD